MVLLQVILVASIDFWAHLEVRVITPGYDVLCHVALVGVGFGARNNPITNEHLLAAQTAVRLLTDQAPGVRFRLFVHSVHDHIEAHEPLTVYFHDLLLFLAW